MNTYARPAEGAKDKKQIKIKLKIKIKSQSQSQSQSQKLREQARSHNGSACCSRFSPLNRPSVSSPESF
ncbi:hypothetical protein [Pseudomonas sp. CLCA07]